MINQNFFIDDRIFTIKPSAEKVYDVVYKAQLALIKMHYLASGIESLALISYLFYPGLREPFAVGIIPRLDHAHWFNKP